MERRFRKHLPSRYLYLQRLLVPSWYVSLGASRAAADLIGSEMMDLRETVLIYKLAERRVKFISGHIVCRPKTRSKFEQEWRFVTVLRDPVKRWVSEFVYNTVRDSGVGKERAADRAVSGIASGICYCAPVH